MQPLIFLAALAALAYLLVQHARAWRALGRRDEGQPRLLVYPSLAVVRPIRGLDPGAAENLQALLESDYPGEIEFVFVLDDAADEAYPLVRAVVESYTQEHGPGRARLLLAGAPPHGRTGKLHAMSVGVRATHSDLVAFSDSDSRLTRDQLRHMVERLLAHDDCGAVFAPALAAEPPRTIGDAGYAIMLNAWYGAVAVTAAARQHELPFIMGQIMILRRAALEDIGGVESADGQLVDDMYLGRELFDRGWHNVMSDRPLRIVEGQLGFSDFMRLMRRWLLFSRSGLPNGFKRPAWLRAIAIVVAILAGAYALSQGWSLTLLVAIMTVMFACLSDVALHRRFGGAPIPLRLWWVSLLVPLVGPWALASLAVDHHVAWRGRDYALDAGAHLRS